MAGNKILVIDDEREVRELCKEFFASQGYEVLTARSGAGALKRLEWEKPDAVILDYAMPIMDGIETLRQIRGNVPSGLHYP